SATGCVLTAIAYGNGQFVAVGGDNGAVVTSTDGVHWVRRLYGSSIFGPEYHWLSGIAYGNGRFVAVGDFGEIWESGSIITLEITTNTDTGPLTLSLEGPSGLDYTIQTSADLVSWRDVTKITSAQSTKVILDGL